MLSAKTVNGDEVSVKTQGGHVHINSSVVTTADIACTNGVIDVIDAVLMPA